MTRRDLIRLTSVICLGAPMAAARILDMQCAGSGDASWPGSNTPSPRPGTLSRYGFAFEEVSQQAGIHFTHQAPELDARLKPVMPIVAAMGASVSVVDFDRDGWPDLYVTNSAAGSQNHLYRNMHDGTFQDVAGAMGVADLNPPGSGACMGAVWGDFDNDGFEDLLVYKWGRPMLFRNEGGKRFVDVTAKSGLPEHLNCNTAIWLDFDGDGRLDLLLGSYYPEDIDLWHLKDTRMMPNSFEYATNGTRKYLLRGKGDGTFEDVTEQMGLTSKRWVLAAAAADLRGTGYPDLVIADDYGVPEFWANDHGRRFHEIGEKVGISSRPKSGMNVCFGDIFNQGSLSIYTSNISERGVLIQGNDLWTPQPGSSGENLRYQDIAATAGVDIGGWSFGAQFGDLNNDGFQDLFLTNGYISGDPDQSYWYDYSKVAGGNSSIIGDAKNWPSIGNRSLSGQQRKHAWVNGGGGEFEDAAPVVGVTQTFDGRSVAMADFWNRGVLDVAMACQRGPLLLYKNHVSPENHWIKFDLRARQSNRSAFGAMVRLFWNGQQQVQPLCGGSGFSAQSDRRLHFGLGKASSIEKVEVRWPSGKSCVYRSLKVDQIHTLEE